MAANRRYPFWLWLGRGGGKPPTASGVSTFGVEVLSEARADASVSTFGVEVVGAQSGEGRVSTLVVEVINGQSSEARVSSLIVEIILTRGSVSPVIPEFPSWPVCPPSADDNDVIDAGHGDGATPDYEWAACAEVAQALIVAGQGDGATPEFEWSACE